MTAPTQPGNEQRARPLTIAMLALGGQGGGVLTRWLVDIAEDNGYIAQSTYVAGVAQRTGATVYCVEMFPREHPDAAGREPVLALYPVPGDVDIAIAAELAETGRAIQKGFVTPNLTTLIASSHRVYSITEKTHMGDGIVDQQPVIELARRAAKNFVCFDMQRTADETGSVISAVILGSIAGSGALPFEADSYREAIRRAGRAVDANLAGFEAGFENARSALAGEAVDPGGLSEAGGRADTGGLSEADGAPEVPGARKGPVLPVGAAAGHATHVAPDDTAGTMPRGPNADALIARILNEFPAPCRELAQHGALRALEYQDRAYADLYLERLRQVAELDAEAGRDYLLTRRMAMQLALQMCYEDVIRVGHLKTRRERIDGIHADLGVAPGQPAYVVEYFHPRYEEFCDTLPAWLGARLSVSSRMRRLLAPLFRKGRNVQTSKLGGFALLYLLGSLRRWRRSTYRYRLQQQRIEIWLARVAGAERDDYDYAVALTDCMTLVRGYGDTHARGLDRFRRILDAAAGLPPAKAAAAVRALTRAAQADEAGEAFDRVLEELQRGASTREDEPALALEGVAS